MQGLQLRISANDASLMTEDAADGRWALAHTGHSVGRDRFRLAFGFDRFEFLEVEELFDEAVGGAGDLKRPWSSGLLHSGGDVDGVAQRGVLHPEVGPDLTHDDEPGVDPDP